MFPIFANLRGERQPLATRDGHGFKGTVSMTRAGTSLLTEPPVHHRQQRAVPQDVYQVEGSKRVRVPLLQTSTPSTTPTAPSAVSPGPTTATCISTSASPLLANVAPTLHPSEVTQVQHSAPRLRGARMASNGCAP
jgi:hypothetical protein